MIELYLMQLTKTFGPKTVFSDVSFDHIGRSLGIAGSNGSGKSTFLKCLGYLLRPSGGNFEWRKEGEVLNKEQVQKKLGYAAPYINLYDELNCIENLEFLAKARHESEYIQEIKEWIQQVGLEQVAKQSFGSLSTGQQQRLRLAAALFHQPDILLLDEPGSNLDEEGRELIAEIATAFKAKNKLLILASNAPEELSFCDRIFSIERGTFL